MTAGVEQLDREMASQAAAFARALAEEQERAKRAAPELEVALLDLAESRRQLGLARAELQWLRRAGVDLNALMERPAVRGARAVGAAARRVARVRPRRAPVSDAPAAVAARTRGRIVPAGGDAHPYALPAEIWHRGGAALAPVPASTARRPLRLAFVVPPFGFGSGGHHVVFALARTLEQRGHVVTSWLHDPHAESPASDADLRAAVRELYAPIGGPVRRGFTQWPGADVAIATGWQTAYPVMALTGCRARAYLVNDHEPEFYPTSLEALYAARSYALGMPCIVGGGPWLGDELQKRYGVEVAARFEYPVAPELRPRPVARREDTVVVYARDSTPRRAVGLALIALEELKRRRPELRVVLFGDQGMPRLGFEYEHLGPATPEELSWVYSEATVGIALSLTHGSLVPHDMLACGLPVVDLEGYGTAAEHAASGLVELAAGDPYAIAAAVERLLDDPQERRRRGDAGRAYVGSATWERAADRVEAGLRAIVEARADVSAGS